MPKKYAIKNPTSFVISACLMVIILVLMQACHSDKNNQHDEENKYVKYDNITKVRTASCEFKEFDFLLQSNGKIRADNDQVLAAQTDGAASMIAVHTGDHVRKGAVLIKFDPFLQKLRLQKAELARFNGEKEYQSQLLGYEDLLKNKTKQQADDIKRKLKISAGLAAAEQEIKEISYDLSRTTVIAPFDGVIADLKIQKRQQIRLGQELLRLYSPDMLLLETKVLESDIHMMRKEQPATVIPVGSDKKYEAHIARISPYVDNNGMVSITLELETKTTNSRSAIFPGMNCSVQIRIHQGRAFVVPKEAVVTRNGKAVVFTFQRGLAKWNYVTVGRENGREIEIKEGLSSNQIVITSNNLQLANDAPVSQLKASDRDLISQ